MLEVFKQRIKHNSGAAFYLLFYTTLLVWFSWLLIKQDLRNIVVVDTIAYLLWIIVSIVQIVINWRNFILVKVEDKKEQAVVSQRHFEEKQTQKIPDIAVMLIISIPVIVIFVIAIFSDEIFEKYTVSNPNYQSLNNYAYISLAIALIFQDLPKLFEIEQEILKRILTLSSIILMFLGFIFVISSANYLTKVAP